jgi:hypothetical protein
MKVKDLIKKLEKFDPNMGVLVEFDSDGDDFMVKVDIEKVGKGNGCDDSWDGDDDEDKKKYCIIKLDY